MKVMMPFPLGCSGRVHAVIGYCFKHPKWACSGCFVQPTEAVLAGHPQPAQKPVGGTLRAWGRGRGRMASGELVRFQVCSHLNKSDTQVFVTFKK